jgi:hypothetical protein
LCCRWWCCRSLLRWPATISSNGRGRVTVGGVLILIAVILFVLAALSVSVASVALVPLGLAFFAAGHLV